MSAPLSQAIPAISPLVSIVMPVKDGADFVGQAIESLLNQTFSDFELIVIDDGSTDETVDIVTSYRDSRIILVSQDNQGVAKAANRGFALTKGNYITRHDHDDISLPTRLEKQVQFLDAHPTCGMVGSWAKIWVENSPGKKEHRHSISPGAIAFELLFNAPFVNASCLFRREVLDWSGGYTEDENRLPPEDYEFFSRISRKFDLANIPEYLMIYREVPNSQSSSIRYGQESRRERFVSNLVRFSAENLAWASASYGVDEDSHNFGCLIHGSFESIKAPINLESIKCRLSNTAEALAIRFHEPDILKVLKDKLLLLDYQYHTYAGNTLHHSRLKYLYFNRTCFENLASVGRLLKKFFFLLGGR